MMERYLRIFAEIVGLSLCAYVAFPVVSCTPPPKKMTVEVRAQSIPPLQKKVFASPDVDWSSHSRFRLELRQKGKPEDARDQILEKYLSTQITDCLTRKGYSQVPEHADMVIYLYWEVNEDRIEVANRLGYGLATAIGAATFNSDYRFSSGAIWRTAGLAATLWQDITTTSVSSVFTGEISIDVFDSTGQTQLWRGDVRANLSTDDIRVMSNWMIRDLLFMFPALDYPAVSVPELPEEEFIKFWNAMIYSREFYSPGQRMPVSFDFSCWKSGQNDVPPSFGYSEDEIRKSDASFEESETLKELKASSRAWDNNPNDPWVLTPSQDYFVARRNYRSEYLGFPDAFEKWAQTNSRYLVAVTDLMQTAPWSLNDGDNIVFAGRYFVGADEQCTLIGVRAKSLIVSQLYLGSTVFNYSKYLVTGIWIMQDWEFENTWKEANQRREMVVGPIDRVPAVPSQPSRS